MRCSVSTSRRSSRSSVGDLNRATLARQLLLERTTITPLAAIERLAGLQAQVPRPPFVGLWSRVPGFQPAHLAKLINDRKAVRATMMRGTIHLVSAADYLTLRGALQPMLSAGMRSILGKRVDGLDLDALTAHARGLLPATFDAVRKGLTAKFPNHDDRAPGYAVRMHLPLVLVPTETRWGYPGNAHFHDAADWLGRALSPPSLETLVLRYLAAFGPATLKDAQAWSGVRKLGEVFEALRDRLVVVRDGDGRELFDLPGAPRPDADVPAPVRFLPEYDNLLLAYADHSRVIEPAQRKLLTTKNGIVAATFLVDGRVAGTWTLERTKDKAVLTTAPFAKLSSSARSAVHAEAEPLLRWHEADATSFTIR
ncbi:winged helix DNA-binding domain-containing protein [soil metagenome]